MAFKFLIRIGKVSLALVSLATASAAVEGAIGVPPEGPRDFSSFTTLMMKSPFVMPTADGDQSPLAQRYTLTGAAKIGSKPHVFLLDVVNQTRLMIAPDQPDGEVSLVALDGDTDLANIRATIRVGSETGVITFAKSQLAPPPPSAEVPADGNGAAPALTQTNNSVPLATPVAAADGTSPTRPPTAAELQQLGGAASPGTLQPVPPRRIIRRQTPVPVPANGQPVPTQ